MNPHELLGWGIFGAIVLVLLALDLGVFHRRAHAVRIREALLWSLFWIAIGVSFAGFVWFWKRDPSDPAAARTAVLEYFAAYLLEKSLSVDNLFVILLLFTFFRVPAEYQHRVLYWGILGALIMRGLFIAGGLTMIHFFTWTLYAFGAFLVWTGVKMAIQKEEELHPEQNPLLAWIRRRVRVTPDYEGGHFFVRRDGRRWATPLFVSLVAVELTDVIFAVDSVPTVIGVVDSHDAMIIYTSNVFAILGLRALYFALAGMMGVFHYLKYGLAVILAFIGFKMIVDEAGIYDMPIGIALGVLGVVLGISVVASVLHPKPPEPPGPPAPAEPPPTAPPAAPA